MNFFTQVLKHADQSVHCFNWGYAHVLHHVNSYHTRFFLESKTNTMNDKSVNLPDIYHYVLKREWNLSANWLRWVCHLIDRFCVCEFVQSHQESLTHYLIGIWKHTFALFTALLYLVAYCAFMCRLYSIYCVVVHCHLPTFFIYTSTFSVAYCRPFHMTRCSILRFCLYTSHLSLFLVIGKLHGMWLKTLPWGSLL